MNKERTISGIKVVVSGETYDEYKGTLQEQLEEKDKEIERLQRQKEELQINGLRQETLFKLEIERLNNIINELEKWLEEDEDKAMITFETGRCFNYHDIINKIEILKGE